MRELKQVCRSPTSGSNCQHTKGEEEVYAYNYHNLRQMGIQPNLKIHQIKISHEYF